MCRRRRRAGLPPLLKGGPSEEERAEERSVGASLAPLSKKNGDPRTIGDEPFWARSRCEGCRSSYSGARSWTLAWRSSSAVWASRRSAGSRTGTSWAHARAITETDG